MRYSWHNIRKILITLAVIIGWAMLAVFVFLLFPAIAAWLRSWF